MTSSLFAATGGPDHIRTIKRCCSLVLLVGWVSGCGLSSVGPEQEKLTAWKASIADGSGSQTSHTDTAQNVGTCTVAKCTTQDPCQSWACEADSCKSTGKRSCDDGNPCTIDGTCDTATGCNPSVAKTCADSNPCTIDGCDSKTGECSFTIAVDSACDDADKCTTKSICVDVGGVATCQGKSDLNCDDGNPCTDDSCTAKDGCAYAANIALCDDGDKCTGATCALKACKTGAKVDCDDGNMCTDDGCDSKIGCTFIANKAPCDDASVCTGNVCADKTCAVVSNKVCDDNDACTDDSCDAKTGCVSANNKATCDDGLACTMIDRCTEGTCKGTPALFDGASTANVLGAVLTVAPLSAGRMLVTGLVAQPKTKTGAIKFRAGLWVTGLAGSATLTEVVVPNPEQLVIRDVVTLPSGVTLLVGGRLFNDPMSAWLAKVDVGTNKVTVLEETQAKGQGFNWTSGLVLPTGTLALGGLRVIATASGIGDAFVRIQFRNSQLKPIATHETSGGRLFATIAMTKDTVGGDTVYACTYSKGANSGLLLRVSAAAGITLRQPFGGANGRCQGVHVTASGDVIAVGKIGGVLGASGAAGNPQAAWWRFNRRGAVVATWTYAKPGGSVLASSIQAPDGSIFAVGDSGNEGQKSTGLLVRIHPNQDTTSVQHLVGERGRQLNVVRWHRDGYLLLGGLVQVAASSPKNTPSSKTVDKVWIATTDPWGHSSCVAAGLCSTVPFKNCQSSKSCTTTVCDANKGCQPEARSGSCDDGQACTTPGRCDKGNCSNGSRRFWAVKTALKLGKALPWVGVTNAPGGGVVAATYEDQGVNLRVVRYDSAGKVLWSSAVKGTTLPAGVLDTRFLLTTGTSTWIGGGLPAVSSTQKGGWMVGFDDKGKLLKVDYVPGDRRGWMAAAATDGGFATLGRVALLGKNVLVLRRWHKFGGMLSDKVINGGGLSVAAAAKLDALALTPYGDGWAMLAYSGTTAMHQVVLLNAQGIVRVGQGIAAKGEWPASLMVRPDGGLMAALGGAKASDPTATVLALSGAHLRYLNTPIFGPTDAYAGAVMLDDGTLLLSSEKAEKQGSSLTLNRTNHLGVRVESTTIVLPDIKNLLSSSVATADGAIVVALRGENTLTGDQFLEVRRMTPWGQASCTAAGKCADASARSCGFASDCQVGGCDAKTGCTTVLAAKTCDSGDPCTGAGLCGKGVCASPAATIGCDDGDPCTNDSCIATWGCKHTPAGGGNCPGGP